ncbi:hypothetical protein MKZ24_12690 [Paenibacillus sp. FSL R7-0297]|nr:hypothetical protein [Paenibacillus sp. FSL R5-0912]
MAERDCGSCYEMAASRPSSIVADWRDVIPAIPAIPAIPLT